MEEEPIDTEPQREILYFEVDENVPNELAEAQKQIKQAAQKLLYHWKSFPIVLPPSISDSRVIDEDGKERPEISFKDLFISPTFDELDMVSKDEEGNAKPLNGVQLQTVRTHGEFDVSSKNFPGQNHKWRLTQLLQKGSEKSRQTMLDDTALALKLLIITARNRIVSPFFSVSNSVTSLTKAGKQLLDILIGLPGFGPGDMDARLHEEHMKYLVAELNVKNQSKSQFSTFCRYVQEKTRELESLRHQTVQFKPPLPCYKIQTPQGKAIDLRLFNRDLINKCIPILKRILTKQSKGWYIKFKDKIIAEMKEDDPDDQLTNAAISEHVNKSIMEEYLRRVFDAVYTSDQLEAISPELGPTLAEQGKAAVEMNRAVTDVREKLTTHTLDLRTHLIKTYPVRSRIATWMNENVESFKDEFIKLNQWLPHEEAIEHCRNENLLQALYFLQRDLTYFRDREPVLTEELSKVRRGTRTFVFAQRIWLPGNWVVKRTLYGETEVIPTVIVESVRNIPPRVRSFDEPSFSVDKDVSRKTSTKFPFWRWINYFYRTWTWTWNAMFWLGVAMPWCSPLSFRALCYRNPFIPELELNPNNGTLSPKLSSKTPTLRSRLTTLWQNVVHSRSKFEAEPDEGFLGKSFTRHLNRFWNYVIKGCLGSVCLVTGFAPLCVVASSFSVIAGFFAPLWMPFVTLAVHIFFIIVYDFDNPGEGNALFYLFEAVVFRFLILGLLQPVAALLSAGIFLPVASITVFLFGLLRRLCREAYDLVMFHLVIQKRARVPAHDSFVAKRIAGPGLASSYFYQIKPEQVLASVESHMEIHELGAWEDEMKDKAFEPMTEYKKFFEQLFKPYSAELLHPHLSGVRVGIYEYNPFVRLGDEINAIIERIGDEAVKRRQKLYTGITPHLREHVKLMLEDLKAVIMQTTKLAEDFYPNRVFSRQKEEEIDLFWERRQLEPEDWEGLAKQLLGEVFQPAFLTPLEDTDTIFRLEVKHLKLGRYLEMLDTGEIVDDLDEFEEVHAPRGEIDVDAPKFDYHNFVPVGREVEYAEFLSSKTKKRNWPWTQRVALSELDLQKMLIPLPIPHPAIIMVHIFNRENDQEPIDIEDSLCQRILRAAEDTPYTDKPQTRLSVTAEESSSPEHTTSNSGGGDSEEVGGSGGVGGIAGNIARPEVMSDYNITEPSSGDGDYGGEVGGGDGIGGGRIGDISSNGEEEEEIEDEIESGYSELGVVGGGVGLSLRRAGGDAVFSDVSGSGNIKTDNRNVAGQITSSDNNNTNLHNITTTNSGTNNDDDDSHNVNLASNIGNIDNKLYYKAPLASHEFEIIDIDEDDDGYGANRLRSTAVTRGVAAAAPLLQQRTHDGSDNDVNVNGRESPVIVSIDDVEHRSPILGSVGGGSSHTRSSDAQDSDELEPLTV